MTTTVTPRTSTNCTTHRTRDRYVDLLGTPKDLLAWAALEGDRLPTALPEQVDETDLRRFLETRDHVLALLRAQAHAEPLPAASVDAINHIARTRPVVRLLHSREDPGEARLLQPSEPVNDTTATIAAATIELLTGSERDRIALCDAPSCGQLFLRDRPNQQWCGLGCGNRARAARHYQRITTA